MVTGYQSMRRRRELIMLAWPFKAVAWSLRINGQDTGDIENRLRRFIHETAVRPRDLAATATLWDAQQAAVASIPRSTALVYFAAVVLAQHCAEHGIDLPPRLVEANEEMLDRLSEASADAFDLMERSSRQRAQKWLDAYRAEGLFRDVGPVPQVTKREAAE